MSWFDYNEGDVIIKKLFDVIIKEKIEIIKRYNNLYVVKVDEHVYKIMSNNNDNYSINRYKEENSYTISSYKISKKLYNKAIKLYNKQEEYKASKKIIDELSLLDETNRTAKKYNL